MNNYIDVLGGHHLTVKKGMLNVKNIKGEI